MADSLKLSVVTPEKEVFAGEVHEVVFPMHDGMVGILPGRAPLLCKLGAGPLKVKADSTQVFFVSGGFAQMRDNQLSILATTALPAADVNAEAARAELAEADAMPGVSDEEHAAKAQAQQAARAKLAMVV